jgi:hypothetical protein
MHQNLWTLKDESQARLAFALQSENQGDQQKEPAEENSIFNHYFPVE